MAPEARANSQDRYGLLHERLLDEMATRLESLPVEAFELSRSLPFESNAVFVGSFAGLALLLAALGIFGLAQLHGWRSAGARLAFAWRWGLGAATFSRW